MFFPWFSHPALPKKYLCSRCLLARILSWRARGGGWSEPFVYLCVIRGTFRVNT